MNIDHQQMRRPLPLAADPENAGISTEFKLPPDKALA